MTQREKTAWGLGLFIVTLVLMSLSFFLRPEPAYHGKPLSQWAAQYGTNHWRAPNCPADQEAEFAIREIGTNAIPFLLDLMRTRDSVVKQKLRTIVPWKWHARLFLRDNAETTRSIGAYGLAALGTNAPEAVPQLIELANHHPDEQGRYIAVFALRTLAAEPAIPFFIHCLTNNDGFIRDEAAIALGDIYRRPEIAVPALVQHVKFAQTLPDNFELRDAVKALGDFESQAVDAVPVLLPLLNHPNLEVRKCATNALLKIDATAAAKAHVVQPPPQPQVH